MCTLSYLPNNKGFFLVNNRDESPLRAIALKPNIVLKGSLEILAPIDAAAKGTWIGVSGLDRFVCLMNGAFEVHQRKESYAKSRGLVAMEFLSVADTDQYFEQYDLQAIEPFTLIVIGSTLMMEYRWDGQQKYRKQLDQSMPQIWSSATLYTSDVAEERARYFKEHLALFQERPALLKAWHKNEIPDSPSLRLQREKVQTLSVSTVVKHEGQYSYSYEDLLSNTTHTKNLVL